jgi:hypothetical protein
MGLRNRRSASIASRDITMRIVKRRHLSYGLGPYVLEEVPPPGPCFAQEDPGSESVHCFWVSIVVQLYNWATQPGKKGLRSSAGTQGGRGEEHRVHLNRAETKFPDRWRLGKFNSCFPESGGGSSI